MHLPKFVLLLGGLFVLPLLACGTVGVYNPQATQAAVQETVSAMQATITALESSLAVETPQVIVVTATPTATSAAAAAQSSLPTATSFPTPAPTPTETGSSQGQTIVIVATLTPTPTPKTYTTAPIITEPRDGAVVEEGREILFRWSWNGLLGPNEHFDVKVRPDGQSRSAYVAWEDAEAHDFQAVLPPGRYYWTVQVIKGYYQNNSGEPEDRVFEAYLSPESEPRLIIVAEKQKEKRKTATPTPTPTDRPTVSANSSQETPAATPDSPDPPPAGTVEP